LRLEQGIVLDLSTRRFLGPISIPTQQPAVPRRKLFQIGSHFRALPSWVKHVSSAKEAPSAFGCFEEHPISSRVWLAVGDAMENDVNINTGTQGFMEAFATSAVNDFVDQKIGSLRMLTMKERCGNPNLISDFDLGKNLGFRRFSP
jgi:hypothetical protein